MRTELLHYTEHLCWTCILQERIFYKCVSITETAIVFQRQTETEYLWHNQSQFNKKEHPFSVQHTLEPSLTLSYPSINHSSTLMNTRSRENILMAESVSRSFRSSSSFRVLIRIVSRLNGMAFNSASKSMCAVVKEAVQFNTIFSEVALYKLSAKNRTFENPNSVFMYVIQKFHLIITTNHSSL